mgnify:CR=1 FL=1
MAVKTAVAAAAGEMVLATLPATVVQPPGARVAVAAPFAGLVRDVAVQPGQAVRRGQLLATLISRDAMQLAAELARAEARRQLTAAERARMEALARAGVVAGARADSAVAADAEARISVDVARRMLAQMGADRSGSVRLVAPIAGRVASLALEAGAAVDGSSAPIVIEAEGSRWLALQVPERLAGSLRPGLAVRTDDGRPALNSGRLLRLVMSAPAPAGAVAVPAAALAADNGADLVFVKGAKGFAARPVTRAGSGDPAVITAGLKAGETVAISNLPELRAAAQR